MSARKGMDWYRRYMPRSRGAQMTLPSNNDARWEAFFLNRQPDAYFETMSRRMALDNLTRDELDAQRVPQIDFRAIQVKFEEIKGKLDRKEYRQQGGTLEDDLEFSGDVCDLKILMQGLEIPPAELRGNVRPGGLVWGAVPPVSISEMRSEVGRTLGHWQEIKAFIENGAPRERQRSAEYFGIATELFLFLRTKGEWLHDFKRRASCNPEEPDDLIQDEFVLGTLNLMESYIRNVDSGISYFIYPNWA